MAVSLSVSIPYHITFFPVWAEKTPAFLPADLWKNKMRMMPREPVR
jgi:hypothetical protein